MQINESIFKSYDIRGIYPSELNEETAFLIGRAFRQYSGAKRAVIAHDARIASPALFKAFAEGFGSKDVHITDIGQTLTEGLYFALGNYDFDAGIMVTASHNPKEYSGFKMMVKKDKDIQVVRGKDILETVKSLAGALESVEKDIDWEIETQDTWKDFSNHVLDFVDLSEIVPLKIVVDASSGVAGLAISKIQESLPIEIIALNFEPNGNFPNHSPNPLQVGSADKIGETIRKEKADFGFIFDGDADRVFLVDEKGELVRADVTLLLLAKYFLAKNPGMAVAYNAICSKAVPEMVAKWGGNPIRTQVGFVNVRNGLLENNGIMGGELSGHYCFKDNYYMDSGIISFLVLLQILSKEAKKVSELVNELCPYVKSPELNFKVENKDEILEKVKDKYSKGQQDFLDGVTVSYKDWWFNVRPSNTEPLLRLTIETDDQKNMDKRQKELTKLITK